MSIKLAKQIKNLISPEICAPEVAERFRKRLEEGSLTREENPQSHACVYFAAYDPEAAEVFLGHHKKSGLWLFNGGHIDKGESLNMALEREISEEWGMEMQAEAIGRPALLTITPIDNPTKQRCKWHFDIWYFIPVQKEKFFPDEKKWREEFHMMQWVDVDQARELVTERNTLEAMERMTRVNFKKFVS